MVINNTNYLALFNTGHPFQYEINKIIYDDGNSNSIMDRGHISFFQDSKKKKKEREIKHNQCSVLDLSLIFFFPHALFYAE